MAKVSFRVPAEEFQKEYDQGLRSVGRRVQMKGFRPGKVPARVLEKQFGTQVQRDVMESFLRRAYQEALDKEGIKPMSHPRVTPDDLEREDDGSFALDFEVGLKPEVRLASYKGMNIESELEPVLEQQVTQVLEDLRRQESVPEPAGDDGVDENGMVLCDITFLHEDEVVFEREGLRIAAHTPPPGVDPEKFAEVFVGAKDESTIEVEMIIPPNVENEDAHGQQGLCRLTVKQAFNMIPPPDEELFGKLEVEDEAGMLAKVRERLEEAAGEREQQRVESVLLERLINETELDLPGALVDEQTDSRLSRLKDQMTEQGVPEEKIEEQVEEQRATAREEAERGLRALLVVEAIGEKESLLVTEEELDTELASIAARNDASLDEVRRYYAENNLAQQMAIEVLERKVRSFLRENAEITAPG